MNERTVKAVHRQLTAMAAERYDLAIVRFCDDGRSLKQSVGLVGLAEIDGLLPKLARQNARGENVFVRPDPALDRALILIDDIEEMDVDKLRDNGLEPCCVVETSPKNLQTWVDFGPEPMPVQERKILARWLAGFVEGDMGSADAVHYGRLSGFTNQKTKHFGSGRNGGFPFVLCRFAEQRVCSKAQGARSWAREQAKAMAATQRSTNLYVSSSRADEAKEQVKPPTVTQHGIDLTGIWSNRADVSDVFRWYCEYWAQDPNRRTRKDGSDDLSTRDFSVTCRLLKEGFDPAEIIRVLTADAVRKGDPKECVLYAKRTVEAALNRL